jgi:hypothetical protein
LKIDYNKPVFVFGSNLAGIHGGGAARDALKRYGAVMTVGRGLQGQSYAIPTKDYRIETLPLSEIKKYVDEFLGFAAARQHGFESMTFNVTRIGCGLAGYKDEQIAPLFEHASPNCNLPHMWFKSLHLKNQCSYNWDKDFDHG